MLPRQVTLETDRAPWSRLDNGVNGDAPPQPDAWSPDLGTVRRRREGGERECLSMHE